MLKPVVDYFTLPEEQFCRMNARQREYRLILEQRQVGDAVSCIFHSLMTHRTVAKFHFSSERNYCLGSLGLAEVDCENIDLTYVRVNSPELVLRLDEEVRAFKDELSSHSYSSPRRTPVGSPTENAIPLVSASIGIDFYQKKKKTTLFSTAEEQQSWERWNIILDVFKITSCDEFVRMRESVAERLGDVVLDLCSVVNRPQYMPKMPTRTELTNVFETTYSDCQPYLFKVHRQTTSSS